MKYLMGSDDTILLSVSFIIEAMRCKY